MEFKFLTQLPKSNLDDRTFKDLVEECILRIPRYCPEWTDYNASDPGITLIELFAWLTDQMLLRFNQVPRRNYVTFLELLGIRLMPPAPAQTEVTFYLTNSLPEVYSIPTGTEVATERTQVDEAITFTTDRTLLIGNPELLLLLSAQIKEETPQNLRDRFTDLWNQRSNGQWVGTEQALFDEVPQAGNCFYLVFGDQPLEGNVLSVTFWGAEATTTGINPNTPPRRWEAWSGEGWEPVLMQEGDDHTRGFSFSETQQGPNPIQGADVVLHMPQHWPVTTFGAAYQGRWLRCMLTEPLPSQPPYASSPRITGVATRAIGGTIPVSHSTTIRHEVVGTSDGIPGQSFQLQGAPILARRLEEYLLVTPPGGPPQTWREVIDFAESGPDDLHYTLDSLTGVLQFGPLVREPGQLQLKTQFRALNGQSDMVELSSQERQYGAVPPRGATLVMVGYRTGGGRQGNVQSQTLRVLKSAVPYVARVTNHGPARNGADAESLDQAVLRAPRILRTRDRAVTQEDYETLAYQGGRGAVARALCLTPSKVAEAGVVRLLLVPQADPEPIQQGEGLAPEIFALTHALQEQVQTFLDERKLLGTQVILQEPEYVGVTVQTEVSLEPAYDNPRAQQEILFSLRVALYRFLNPLLGGLERQGWPFGRPVYPSDIVALLQQIPGVRYLGDVQLFRLRATGDTWLRERVPMVDPGPLGLVCSWADSRRRSSHIVNLINRER
ncbi:putative baseplate assembly protein [Anthocerotibacter panamensis]|uniref:putative baseplate assembly protein n=1 Tax=Anthocerotibacter panamensis TaxID=2857077 RepID=UPI001C4033E2|nr:putative baseplate assembly protein [Anthocerotibacter panamensis]